MNAHNIEQPDARSQLSSSDGLGDVLARRLEKEALPPRAIELGAYPRLTGNRFRHMWELGYRRLLPVIPPDAPIRSAGKRPGLKIGSEWQGRGKNFFDASEAVLDIWAEMGAGVGLLCDAGVVGIDIDTLSAEWSKRILAIAAEELGKLPRRIGLAPKTLLMARCYEGARYRQIRFTDGSPPIERNGKARPGTGLVELLAGVTCYFNVLAIHPKTGRPYELPDGLPSYESLPRVTSGQLDRFFERVAAEVPALAMGSVSGIDRAKVDQDGLKGDHDLIAEAMAFLPNDPAVTGYDEWVRVAAACRGAFQDDYGLGFELFEAWSDKADIADPSETAARVYGSIQAPFGLGAGYIFEQARISGWIDGWQRTTALTWFDDAPELAPEALFPSDKPNASIIRPIPYSFRDPSTIPPRQTLYGGHYVRQFVSTTVAPSKVGKSSLIVTEALAMASGRPLLGIRPSSTLRVWIWNGEDPFDELERHVAATMIHYGLRPSDLCEDDGTARLMLGSGRDMEIVLAATQSRDGARIATPVVDAVTAAIRDYAIDVLIIDPFVSSHRVPENDNGAIDMVAKQWARIADQTGAAIELVHHVRKLNGAAATIEDGRGAIALIAASRSARALAKMTAEEERKLGLTEGTHRQCFRISDAAANLGLPPAGAPDWFKLESVALGNGAGDGPDRFISGDSLGVVTRAEFQVPHEIVQGTEKDHALELVAAGEWRQDIRTRDAWVGNPIGIALGLDPTDATDQYRIKAVIKTWIAEGSLKVELRPDAKSRQRSFIVVAKQPSRVISSRASLEIAGGIFD